MSLKQFKKNFQGLETLSGVFIKNPEEVEILDLSHNKLSSGIDFYGFGNLKILILDDNNFESLETFPLLTKLETFSANKN